MFGGTFENGMFKEAKDCLLFEVAWGEITMFVPSWLKTGVAADVLYRVFGEICEYDKESEGVPLILKSFGDATVSRSHLLIWRRDGVEREGKGRRRIVAWVPCCLPCYILCARSPSSTQISFCSVHLQIRIFIPGPQIPSQFASVLRSISSGITPPLHWHTILRGVNSNLSSSYFVLLKLWTIHYYLFSLYIHCTNSRQYDWSLYTAQLSDKPLNYRTSLLRVIKEPSPSIAFAKSHHPSKRGINAHTW